MTDLLPWVLFGVGVAAVAAGAVSIGRSRPERRLGALVSVDVGPSRALRSERYRLVGRPDAVRRRADGASVPVELKHRACPPAGPFPSHTVQLAAYLLLLEETTGVPPPFGVLRYTDREVIVRWDAPLRRRLFRLLAEVRAEYDGRADPSPAKCAGCAWSPGCDASLAGRGYGVRRATYTSVR